MRQARGCWPQLAGILGLSLLSTPLALLLPLPLKIVVDSVVGNQPAPGMLRGLASAGDYRRMLMVAGGVLLGTAVLMHLQSLVSWLLQTYTGEKLVLEFRARWTVPPRQFCRRRSFRFAW